MVLFGGAEAGRTGGWLTVGVALGVGGGVAGIGVGGYSAFCSFAFVFDFLIGVFGDVFLC